MAYAFKMTLPRKAATMVPGRQFVAVAFVAVLGLGGDGVAASETRAFPAFREIETDGEFDLDVTVGAPQSVVLEGDADDLESLKARVVRSRLKLEADGRQRDAISVTISLAELTAVELEGANDAALDGVDSERFELVTSGSGDVTVTGTCGDLTIAINGSAEVDAGQFECRDVEISISGSGDAEVYATDTLNVSIAGSGKVRALGQPQGQVRLSVSGSGKVEMN